MRKIRFGALCFFAASGIGSSIAGTLSDAPVVFRSGEWSVLRAVDQMTDKVSCTGIYRDNYGVQLTGDRLYIKVRGGLKGVVLRFGDQPVEKMRLPSKIEQSIGSISLEKGEFVKLLGSSRLRAQVLTVLDKIADFDLDLSGLSAAVENIRAQCPGEPIDGTQVRGASACGDKVLARLQEKGVPQETIEYACALK